MTHKNTFIIKSKAFQQRYNFPLIKKCRSSYSKYFKSRHHYFDLYCDQYYSWEEFRSVPVSNLILQWLNALKCIRIILRLQENW